MTPPRIPSMSPKHFLLRVYSVQEDGHGSWEVRAAARLSPDRLLASLFYHETNALNLPPMDSIIHVLLDDSLTAAHDAEKMQIGADVEPSRPVGEVVLDEIDHTLASEPDPALYQPGG